jgi:hypothetical protein
MKKIYLLIASCLIAKMSLAQKNPFFNSDELRTVRAVAGGALYVLRQDFYILDTTVKPNKKSGLNGNNYFGRYYFLALYADGKFYTDRNINSPWDLDAQFNTIRGLKKYMPVLSGFAFRQIDSVSFISIDSIADFNKKRRENSDTMSLYAALSLSKNLPMLTVANNTEKLTDSTSFHWTLNVKEAREFNQKRFIDTIPSPEFDLTKGKYSLEKKSFINPGFFYGDKTIGGFVFTTKPSFGKVEYRLSGVIIKNKNGKFESVPISQTELEKKDGAIKEKVDSKKDEPIKPVKITEIKDN